MCFAYLGEKRDNIDCLSMKKIETDLIAKLPDFEIK